MAMHNGSDGWGKIFADEGQDLDLLATPGHTPAQRVMHTSDAFFRRFLMLWLGFGVLACIYTLFWAREALYAAVAEVLAYVYQLTNWRKVGGAYPQPPREIVIPAELAVEAVNG